MGKVKIVSFDVEGTLISPDFSQAVWHESIPSLYAEMNGVSFEEAKAFVEKAYDELGDGIKDWYDITYWFKRFRLRDYRRVLEANRHRVFHYPEVPQVLRDLGKIYPLIVTSSSAREFLPYLLDGMEKYFVRMFSSISDYGQLKDVEFYTRVCHEIGIRPDELAHVGDSWKFDFLAAREAGIKAFHIDRSQETKDIRSLTNLMELKEKLLNSAFHPN